MNKKVAIGTRPSARAELPAPIEDWVGSRATGDVPDTMKRLTFDVPLKLHTAIKTDCAARNKKMNEEIVAMLEARWRPERKVE